MNFITILTVITVCVILVALMLAVMVIRHRRSIRQATRTADEQANLWEALRTTLRSSPGLTDVGNAVCKNGVYTFKVLSQTIDANLRFTPRAGASTLSVVTIPGSGEVHQTIIRDPSNIDDVMQLFRTTVYRTGSEQLDLARRTERVKTTSSRISHLAAD